MKCALEQLYAKSPISNSKREVIVSVKQDEQNPVTIEVLAESIKAISAGVKALRNGKLKDDALILLIQHAAPTIKHQGRYSRARLTPKAIRAVLQGLESLEQTYIKRIPK